MGNIKRSTFLKQSIKAGAFILLQPSILKASTTVHPFLPQGEELMRRLVTANDAQVAKLLQTDFDKRAFNRRIAHDLNLLTASYCCQTSRYYKSALVLSPMQKLVQHLLTAQGPDGTVNVGNLESPPDTGFIVELVTAAATVLQKEASEAVSSLQNNLKTFLLRTGDALVVGGVHTPNHRWVVSAALARINALYPAKKFTQRIEEWLSEGVYINNDGNYLERSRIYSLVENNAFLSIGRLLDKPSLLEPVRKNLLTTYYYMEPNGELVTNDSRRQDQYNAVKADANVSSNITNYYLLYRYMAIHDNHHTFAAIARMIEGLKGFEEAVLNRSLIYFLEEPVLQKELPVAAALPVNYEKLFPQSHLLRVRRGETTATLFGGVDWPLKVASGRSSSPDFFSYRKGAAVLKYMRLSSSFFSTGYFYSEGLKKVGNNYVLHKKLVVPYYQPLPKKERRKDGDYKLSESVDGRFWNKMDFENRPVSNVKTMDTTVTLSETAGNTELQFAVTGFPGVLVTIELCFKEGGTLSGTTAGESGNSFLETGTGSYAFGSDTIQFGPGNVAHRSIDNLEGERYSTHFGSLRTNGMHVYITGITPFVHKLSFR